MNAAPPPHWAQDRAETPNSGFSRFIGAGGLTWHVQTMGNGPIAFLVHGTGAATHSWRDLAPALAAHFTVIAVDLPGHGYTTAPAWHRLSLPGMARDLKILLDRLAVAPALAIGHSAGAAILARMCIDGMIAPSGLVSLNGAFLPLAGSAGQFFAPLARLLVGMPLVPQLFARRAADPRMVDRLLTGTGSRLDEAGVGHYARIVRNPDHAVAALRMMANWDLVPVVQDLPRLTQKLLLVVGDNDRAIPPSDALRVQALVPGAEIATLPGLGHLAHEEESGPTAALIMAFARSLKIGPPE
jgi:magnesium chelatase accessory protein